MYDAVISPGVNRLIPEERHKYAAVGLMNARSIVIIEFVIIILVVVVILIIVSIIGI